MSTTTDTVTLVTGGNRGIGFEVCRQLAQKGYTVVLGSRDASKGEEAAKRLQDEGLNVTAKQLDVTDEETLREVYGWLEGEHGRLDVLVNNAGIDYDTDQNVLSADLERVRNVFDVNTLGPWRVAQVFVPLLKKSDHGRLVNVSSGAGELSSLSGGTPAYSMSKAALNALTLMLSAELKSSGILVNAAGPGWVATDMGGSGGRPIEEGGKSVVWVATLPDDGPTGGFFRDGKRVEW